MVRFYTVVVVAMTLASVSPSYALDSGKSDTQEDIMNACHASFVACNDACGSMGGTGFSSDFRRINCNADCERFYDACLASTTEKRNSPAATKGRPGALGN